MVAGSRVLDPFCGTASTLLSAANLGAATVGVEVDARVLHGGERGCGIWRNFEHAGLPPPEQLLCGDSAKLDALLPPEAAPVTTPIATSQTTPEGEDAPDAADAARFARFDAIITDPPYGLMEGLGSIYVPLGRRVTMLLQLAVRRLRVGGRLVAARRGAAAAHAAGLPARRRQRHDPFDAHEARRVRFVDVRQSSAAAAAAPDELEVVYTHSSSVFGSSSRLSLTLPQNRVPAAKPTPPPKPTLLNRTSPTSFPQQLFSGPLHRLVKRSGSFPSDTRVIGSTGGRW